MSCAGFSSSNGRTIFDNGVVRIWQCPYCKWWRPWHDERCSACGALRELSQARFPNQGQGSPVSTSSRRRLTESDQSDSRLEELATLARVELQSANDELRETLRKAQRRAGASLTRSAGGRSS